MSSRNSRTSTSGTEAPGATVAAAKSPIDAALDRVIPTELGDPVPYRIPVTAYPTDSKMLLVNSPGSGELKDGREGRWKKLALQLQHRGLCTMVTYNAPRPDFEVQLEWEPYSYRGASWNQLLDGEPVPHYRLVPGKRRGVMRKRRARGELWPAFPPAALRLAR